MAAPINWTQAVNPNYLYLLPEFVVVATMLIIMVVDFYVKEKRWLVWGTVAGLALAMVSTWFTATDLNIYDPSKLTVQEFFGNMVVADPFSFFMKAVLLGVAALVTLLSMDYVEKYLKGMHVEFFEVLLAATLGMIFMVTSRDVITIYVGLELSSICSYVLAGLLRKDAKSNEAGLKYFLNGALASAVLLFGLSLIYGAAGTTYLPEVVKYLKVGVTDPGVLSLLVAGTIIMAGGFAFKIAAVPMHFWAPDVYEGAPTPVTGFFSVGPKGAAFGAILRIFAVGLGISPLAGKWSLTWAVLSVASMFIGNITALMQTNIKRMMAYSSIAQAGYILVGVVAMGADLTSGKGIAAVLFYVMAYALTNVGIFAVLTHMDQEGQGVTVEDFKGLFSRNPFYAVTLLICFVSLIGIPPTAGFFGKLFLFNAALDAGYLWLALVMAVNSVISVGYYYGVVKAMFLEKSDKQALPASTGVMATVVLSFLGVLAAGIISSPIISYVEEAARLLR
ncbi:MAG TPA: NADH-quinone oxidoreductase subunit N [Symbiobacteriaceae bacterium]|nr:NADH-quinone oxidoreductase subunit N [Symbiobacteriaceae bacterium]